jgi:formate dehydrogenase alpha subunit
MASCVTPVAADMVIRTDSDRVLRHRRNIVRLMLAEHPESCVVCSKGNRCALRQIAAQLGVGTTGLYPMPNARPLEEANPFIVRDLSKCILCARCIRADHELVGVGAIDYNLRGFRSRPATLFDRGLEQSSCTFCGTCVAMCPTGALSIKGIDFVGTPESEHASVCGFCGVGCSLLLGVAHGQVVEVNPSEVPGSVNGATLCVRGHFAHDFLHGPHRLTEPLRRRDGWQPMAWDEAVEQTAEQLLRIKKAYGPQSIALVGSSKCSNEENYLFQKFARVCLGTNNIDNGGYASGRLLLRWLDQRTEGGCRRAPLSELVRADALLVIGADPTHSVPVVGYHLKRAAAAGVPLIVADPRRTELAERANVWLQLQNGGDLNLINALAALLVEAESYDTAMVYRSTENFSRFRSSLARLDIEAICRQVGVSCEQLRETAAMLRGRRIAFVVGGGIIRQPNALTAMEALFNLALLTDSLVAEGAGIYLLSRENNAWGAFDMGAVPDMLPGRLALRDEKARRMFEHAWQVRLSPDAGLNLVQMVEAAEKGNLKAIYVMGENPLRTLPQPNRAREAFAQLELLVVQDILMTETAQAAHILLPGAPFSEKTGSFTNLEGRVQNFTPALKPPGDALPDWEILDRLTAALNRSSGYGRLESLRHEMRGLLPLYADWRADRDSWLQSASSLGLFRPDGNGPLTRFGPVVSLPAAKPPSDYPYTAILGTTRRHLGSGTRTERSRRIDACAQCGRVTVAVADAEALGIADGMSVRISSPWGAIQRLAQITDGLPAGTLFIPLAFSGNDAMQLVELSDLAAPEATGWQCCPVTISRAGNAGAGMAASEAAP